MWRERPFPQPTAFIEPCLPRAAKQPPAGRGWIHEIKHDGFRIMARRADGRVQLLTRKGTNFASRFPQIIEAMTGLPVRSCLIDGEAIVCNGDGLAVFDLLRSYQHDGAAVLCAFDLLELDGEDLRRTPIETTRRRRRSGARPRRTGPAGAVAGKLGEMPMPDTHPMTTDDDLLERVRRRVEEAQGAITQQAGELGEMPMPDTHPMTTDDDLLERVRRRVEEAQGAITQQKAV